MKDNETNVNKNGLAVAIEIVVATILILLVIFMLFSQYKYPQEVAADSNINAVEQGEKKFLISYEVEMKMEQNNSQENMESFQSVRYAVKGTSTEFHKDETAAREAAERRMEECYPEKDGWVNRKIEVIPQPPIE